MTNAHNCDPALYGAWPDRPAYADEAAPEIKSRADRLAAEDAARNGSLRQLLNELTEEMRDQVCMYRNLRQSGEAGLLPDADDTEGKQARADVKVATDQLSLIVRTLERIDALQRVLAEERQALMGEDENDTQDYEAAVAHFLKRIDELADQKCRERLEAMAASGTPAGSD
ncbi:MULTISPECIES: hypothetical protein [Agrobacterium tumefaciens complex]|uniref:hypothetical protein n=1 Tax=Agrobacterium tumefaciens complex TaxID=1183400 RepID=UPI000DDA9DFF|nr:MULTISPECIES: hypothetical protein [Agrobacterium tumefaciens complex]MBB4405242.1 hypothetical protein [Agrobacterium radiobacter]MBB4451350.1 hypothetical protein [Agrobacterium radiobacter]MDR6589452.1 hypothetical protein [Agrobacterium tumefaciens]